MDYIKNNLNLLSGFLKSHIRRPNSISFCSFLIAITVIFYTNYHFKVYSWLGTISYDVAGYYYYLPTLFLDNLSDPAMNDYVIDNYDPNPDGWYLTFDLPNGNQCMKYTVGTAIVYLPAFVAAHLWVKVFGGYSADGFSLPYQMALHWWCAFISIIGLWFCRKSLLEIVDDKAVAITLIVIAVATNFLAFCTWASPMTHCIVFTHYSILIYLIIRWYRQPTYLHSFFIGLLMGLVFLTRPPELIFLSFIALWGIGSLMDISERVFFLQKNIKLLAAMIVAFIAVASIQFIYWKYVSGDWVVYSYGDQKFNFLNVHFANGMFSIKKGWLIYTPVMILALLGLYWLRKQHPKVFLPVFVFTALNIWMVFSWQIWWYSGGPGQRSMIQSYAVLAIPMATFFQAAINFRWFWKLIISVFIVCCIWMNVAMTMANYLIVEEMNWAYFLEVIGKIDATPATTRLIDNPTKIPFYVESSLKKVSCDIAEIIIAKQNEFGNEQQVMLPQNTKWIRVKGIVRFDKNGNQDDHCILLNLFKLDKRVKGEKIIPSKFMTSKGFSEFTIECFTGNDSSCDEIRINVSSASAKGVSTVSTVEVFVSDKKKIDVF